MHFYFGTFIHFHINIYNQSDSIEENLQAMDVHLHNLGYPGHCIHTEPIIRGEEVYETMSLEDRRKLFDAISHFTRKSPIRGKTFFYENKYFSDKLSLIGKMARDISINLIALSSITIKDKVKLLLQLHRPCIQYFLKSHLGK